MNPFLIPLTLLCFTVANLLTCYLYIYPVVQGCAFPSPPVKPPPNPYRPPVDPGPAPFRLLVLGDPQLEGDSSLLFNAEDGSFPTLRRIYKTPSFQHAKELITQDLFILLQYWRKKLDLLGNDYYLAHIYRTLSSFTYPTHVAVLGDLLGSQWVSDEEFDLRGRRFWGRVFQRGRRVDDSITDTITRISLADQDELAPWKDRVINVAGNHDIGYAGDMSAEKLDRFERVFGKANWESRFTLPPPPSHASTAALPSPEIRLVILNSLNLEAPALSTELQHSTYDFLNEMIANANPVEDTSSAMVLLTHLPLHKAAGTCVDPPLISYYSGEHGGGVREQNHLSPGSSKNILEGLYGMSGDANAPALGMGRDGIILTGHDHEGCDVYHYIPRGYPGGEWEAERLNKTNAYKTQERTAGMREITVRSMMGDFGGNAGLLSGWFEYAEGRWHFEYQACALGTQHIWWAIHVFDLVTIGLMNFTWWASRREARRMKVGEEKKTQ